MVMEPEMSVQYNLKQSSFKSKEKAVLTYTLLFFKIERGNMSIFSSSKKKRGKKKQKTLYYDDDYTLYEKLHSWGSSDVF